MIRLKLEEIMRDRNLTQMQLSELSNISQGTLSRVIRDRQDTINKKHLFLIMKALNITDFNEILELELSDK